MSNSMRNLLSGNEAVAQAAFDAGIALGTGYPGTPSSEILDVFSTLGGRAQWAPNEKVALEVAIGASFGNARALVTMKHVGLNVAADPLFTLAHTGVDGALVIVICDDPGMASSQNEQDSRRYALAAGVPMIEPSNSQEAYDFFYEAIGVSENWETPVFLRLTTRICHSKSIVRRRKLVHRTASVGFERNPQKRVMIPAFARLAHRKLRAKLAEIGTWAETADFTETIMADTSLGIIANGVSVMHAIEAAPDASILKLGMTYPLPLETIRRFTDSVERCIVIEEGDPFLATHIRSAGIAVEAKAQMYRFGELNVERVQRILANDTSAEASPPKGKPPALCQGCPHRIVFETLRDMECIVSGDIGCYTLGVLPPFTAIDTCVCMGASIGVGLGLRHVLPEKQAKKVVSVIGDSTFVHSGLTGIAEMVYNPPATGHVVLILDNSTTAMTGLQEHPGTGRKLDHTPTTKLIFEDTIRAMGVKRVDIIDQGQNRDGFVQLLTEHLALEEPSVLICRRPCILAAVKQKQLEREQNDTDAKAGE